MQPAAAGSAAVGLLSIVVLQNEKNDLNIIPCFCLIINYFSPFCLSIQFNVPHPKWSFCYYVYPALLSNSPSIYYL